MKRSVVPLLLVFFVGIGHSLDPSCDNLSTRFVGTYGTADYKMYFQEGKEDVSPWHDIPLVADGDAELYNFIVEIPKYTTAKMEVNKENKFNPIMQDIKKEQPRFYKYGITFFNYGLLPQTWEDPGVKDSEGNGGDNDPLDVMEVGSRPLPMGSVVPVKVLGCLELIDEGETDHKIIVLAADDPLASRVGDMAELEAAQPGVTEALATWLKLYKTADGKPANRLRQDAPTPRAEALEIIRHCSERYQALMAGEIPDTGFWLRGSNEDESN